MIGGATNILYARKHFVMSLNLQNPKLNSRAFYGLIMACKAFSELSSKQKNTARSNIETIIITSLLFHIASYYYHYYYHYYHR